MSQARFYVGDTRDVTATLEDNSVDLILTSPPFLALRSYLPADHPDKGREIGSEPTPADFVDTLLELTAGWRRVLAPHGSIAVELGDTYSGSGGAGGDYNDDGLREGQAKFSGSARRGSSDAWPLAKSLTLIPELFRIALVYGINPLTGQPSPAGQWRARNVVRWVRPNPPVGALGDKFRPATSEMVVACVSDRRWFDLDAVRTEHGIPLETRHRHSMKVDKLADPSRGAGGDSRGYVTSQGNPAGAPPLDWWTIPTAPYKGAHYATWPPELCRIPIESMCPRHVCNVCGQPRRRITETTQPYIDLGRREVDGRLSAYNSATRNAETVGWSDCGHDNWRPGLVLDPFAGSGTTLAVATGHGRDAIGIDLDHRNLDLARERVGMFLTEAPKV